jgi:hypothetical protein
MESPRDLATETWDWIRGHDSALEEKVEVPMRTTCVRSPASVHIDRQCYTATDVAGPAVVPGVGMTAQAQTAGEGTDKVHTLPVLQVEGNVPQARVWAQVADDDGSPGRACCTRA